MRDTDIFQKSLNNLRWLSGQKELYMSPSFYSVVYASVNQGKLGSYQTPTEFSNICCFFQPWEYYKVKRKLKIDYFLF